MASSRKSNWFESLHERGGIWTIEAIAAITAIAAVGHLVANPEPLVLWALEFGIALGIPATLVFAGYAVSERNVRAGDRWRLALGTVLGLVVAGLFGAWVALHQQFEGGLIFDSGYFFVTTASFGALVGLLGSIVSVDSPDAAAGPQRARVESVPADGTGENGSADGTGENGSADGTGEDALSRETGGDAFRRETVVDAILADETGEEVLADETVEGVSAAFLGRWLAETVLDDGDRRRLHVLRYLQDTPEDGVTIDELASYVLMKEAAGVSEESRREPLLVELHHAHLPRLADAGLLSYDPDERVVRSRPD